MLHAADIPPTNLPTFLTTFVGREREISDVKQQLRVARLLTLTGPAGCGKTRLALQAATQLIREYHDGTWWYDLAGVTDPAHITQTIAAVVRQGLAPASLTLDHIMDALSSQQALLVLDNCEHLLAGCAALSLSVLSACPGVTILATSLQPLGLPQEQVWPVMALSVPGPVDVPWIRAFDSDAVRLFVNRAQRAAPSFQLTPENWLCVAAICRRLDGLPLALELAAARMRLLTLEQVAERLDDALSLLSRGSLSTLPRHKTLRLAIDWSWQFLTEAEQVLLRQLAVFAGPFTLPVVEMVCGTGLDEATVLDLLDGLADKSLVVVLPRDAAGEPHFRLLEVIRQYARERLEAAGEAGAIRDRQLEWCANWAEQAAKHLTGPGRGAWLAQFEQQQEHFRAALRWACMGRRVHLGLRLAGALGRFWMTSGISEGRAWLEELLGLEAAADDSDERHAPDPVRAWALLYAGRLAVRQGDALQGQRRGEESLAVFQAAGETAGRLAALNVLALAAQDSNDYERAETYYREALANSRESGDERMTAVLLVNQGLMFYEQEDFRRVAPLWDEAYAIIERLDDDSIASRDNLACLAMMRGDLGWAQTLLERERQRLGEDSETLDVSIILMDQGELARRKGDLAAAQDQLGQALQRQKKLGDQYRVRETLANLGNVARNREDWPAAESYFARSLAGLEGAGYTQLISRVKTGLGLVAEAQGQHEAARALFHEALRAAERGRHQLSRVEALEGLASILARQGEAQRAARWLAATERARRALGAPLAPVELKRHDPAAQQLRAALGDVEAAALRSEGAILDVAQLAVTALGAGEAHRLPPEAEGGTAPPRLRILALGPTRVMLGERALTPGDWTYAKSRELLFYLLAHGPASKADIGLDLWPDMSSNQLRAAFHSALHHLRRALGRVDWIVYSAGEYAVNGALPLEYDAALFENHLRQSKPETRRMEQPVSRSEAISHLTAAAKLWRGDFLAEVEAGDWVVYQREALRQAYLDGLLRLGELHFAEAQYAGAAAAFQQALGLDSYLELAHRGLMRCFARQGEAGQAVRHFQNLRQLLQRELQAAPSPETTLLYERIRRGDDV